MSENICRPKCITSERSSNVEQKAADKCVHEYNMLNQAADRAADAPVPSLAERCGAYEYIRGIHGDLNRGIANCSYSEHEKQ